MTVTLEPTQTPPLDLPPGPEPRRVIRGFSFDDKMTWVGAFLGSLGLTWLLFHFVFFTAGIVGFVAFWYLAFVVAVTAITAVEYPRPIVIDRLATTLVGGAAAILFAVLASAVGFVFVKGAKALYPGFVTHDMSGVSPLAPLHHGGIEHAIVGSLVELGIAIVITVPLGIGCAVYMSEVGGRFAPVVRTVVEAMTALPSIVAGLFIYTIMIRDLHFLRIGFSAALAMSVMGLPIQARATDVVLRVVPGGLREASFALGASRWQTVWRVVLPTARPGLATATILATARMIGETSPVLLTSGASSYFNVNPFHNEMNSLPLLIFYFVRSGEPNAIARAFGAAFVLLVLVMLLFIAARVASRRKVS